GAYLALFAGITTMMAGVLVRRAGTPLAVAFPLVALAVEELRASGELGFPWFQPGYTQHAFVPVIQLASLGSVSLVTLWLLGVNAASWRAWKTRRPAAVATALVLFAIAWVWGGAVVARAPRPSGPAVGLVQGCIPGEIKWAGGHEQEILNAFLELSRRAASDSLKPDIVIWPETATGSYLRKQLDQMLAVTEFAAREHVTVFSGFPDYELGSDGKPRYLNAGGLFRPDGPWPTVYAKRHLVPFGERMPFQWLVPGLGKIDLGQAEWTPGRETVLFPGGSGRFGCLVCFESIFPDLARDDVRRGATWLVNVTNDEWFGLGAALYQHAAMAVFRSVENRVPLARCANTGLTMMVDPWGRVTAQAPVWKPAVVVARLAAPGPPTMYDRFGDWPGAAALVTVCVLACVALGRALTPRRRAE
ncbi:MAG TPA: apolipoprotein N-acyltransferase, partial [Dongiaceae bacterium]|nr:apolipoprotein N-acyltransferase [Dongiaceae bacterium]